MIRAAAALLLAGWLLACGGTDPAELRLDDIPEPAAAADEAVRRHLAGERARVVERIDGGAEPAELAAAVGQLGRVYHAYGLLPAAKACYGKAGELAPDDHRWPYYRGYLLQTQGDLDAAADAYERSLELRAAHAAALYRLAEVELDRDRPAAARALYRRTLETEPGFSAAHYGLGRAALARHEYGAARKHLERALAAQPEATRIHHSLGLAHRGAGDLEQARTHLERRGNGAVRVSDPLVAELETLTAGSGDRLRRALEASERGATAVALEELRAALRLDPEDPTNRHNLAVALTRAGQADAAAAQYREILDRDPANATAHFNLGTLLGQSGDLERAIRHFRRAVDAAPDFKQASFNLAAALARTGRWQEAVAEYDRVLALDPGFSSVRTFRAVALVESGRVAEGLQSLRQLAAERPDDVTVRLAEAQALVRSRDFAAATRRLEEAHGRFPRDANLALALARLLASCPDPALRDGGRALDVAQRLFEARRSREHGEVLAMALAQVGRLDEAARLQTALVEEARKSPDPDLLRRLESNLERYRRGEPAG